MKVVVVEDDEDLRNEIVQYLARRGHEVVACDAIAGAQRALAEMGAADGACAVVCDANLPDGDGVDLYLEMAPSLPACRWLLMSGGHDHARLADRLAAQRGAEPLVVDKPVSLRHLHRLISET